MKVLVIGLGSIGQRHARCFRSLGVDEVAGVDPTPERRERFTAETGGPAYATEAEGLAAGPDIVVVASPNVFHIRQARMAADAGKAMLIEKPMGVDLAEARDAGALIEARGLYAHMGSNWKFHPAFKTMKEWIAGGRIGRVTGVQALAGQWLPDWHPDEDYRQMYAARLDLGGGAIFDTHELDYMAWMLGPIVEFCGFKAHSGALEIGTEDVGACVMRFQSGALGTLATDYIQRVSCRRYHISGSEGTIEWQYSDGHVTLHAPGQRDAERRDVRGDVNDMYVAQARRVLEDVRAGAAPETPIAAMLRVLELQTRWHEQTQTRLG